MAEDKYVVGGLSVNAGDDISNVENWWEGEMDIYMAAGVEG